VEAQKSELVAIMDRASQLNLNAVMFQVRPACDALYVSGMEPWSEYLSGEMGRAPEPAYDPLALAIQEAHRRGLELHAWFNPFRARGPSATSTASAGHISRTQPHLVKRYGSYAWLDPGEADVEDYSRSVILDVVKRYDIDGVHLDDYFYPYPQRTREGKVMEFPDGPTYQRYRAQGGALGRADWRRANVDRFVQRLYEAIKQRKKWVKFGVSPFGIWKSGHPEAVRGMSAVEEIYADSHKWFSRGWVDYFSPQLYWKIAAPRQSFPALLRWWEGQNDQQRHLWPGLSLMGPASEEKRPAEEVVNQINLVRSLGPGSGQILYSMKALLKNEEGVAVKLARSVFAEPALVPASPWLDSTPPVKPGLKATAAPGGGWEFEWGGVEAEPVRWWVVQIQTGKTWSAQVLPGSHRQWTLKPAPYPQVLSVRALDRAGNAGPPSVIQWKEP
jgi:uncharacterized lipoprotein YddW (UPF0748 family)